MGMFSTMKVIQLATIPLSTTNSVRFCVFCLRELDQTNDRHSFRFGACVGSSSDFS